ncbi:MAG: hypothetical protein K6V73_09295 [Firmicutes bacterium]|nr:hypothetical protein [Bacillota bacterium]
MARHWRRAALAALAVAPLALGIGAYGASALGAAPGGGDMVITWSQNVQTIDPNKIYNAEDWNVGHALYVGLYDFGRNAQLVPALADGMPQVSDHGLVYTIHLRPGLHWSNGAPITAYDFAASINRELNPKTQSPDGYLWYMLKGAQAVESGHATSVAGVRVLNATTIQYTLTQPYPPFP